MGAKTEENQMASGPCLFARMFYSQNWEMLLTSDSFFFKTKFATRYYWIDTIAKQSTFFIFCVAGRNPFDSSVSFETFFRYCRCIKFFKLFWLQNKSLICRGKKVTENKLKSFDYGFKIFIPVNVKANFSFAIHQSKTVVMILVNTFDVSSLS